MQRRPLLNSGAMWRWNRPIQKIRVIFIVSSTASGHVPHIPTFLNIFGSSPWDSSARHTSSIASPTYFQAS